MRGLISHPIHKSKDNATLTDLNLHQCIFNTSFIQKSRDNETIMSHSKKLRQCKVTKVWLLISKTCQSGVSHKKMTFMQQTKTHSEFVTLTKRYPDVKFQSSKSIGRRCSMSLKFWQKWQFYAIWESRGLA